MIYFVPINFIVGFIYIVGFIHRKNLDCTTDRENVEKSDVKFLFQKIDKIVSPTLDLKQIRPPGSEAAQHSKLTHL